MTWFAMSEVSVISCTRNIQNTVTFAHDTKTLLKAKQSRNRLGVAQRVPGGIGSQIFMTFGT